MPLIEIGSGFHAGKNSHYELSAYEKVRQGSEGNGKGDGQQIIDFLRKVEEGFGENFCHNRTDGHRDAAKKYRKVISQLGQN
jgi:hypothetical protein